MAAWLRSRSAVVARPRKARINGELSDHGFERIGKGFELFRGQAVQEKLPWTGAMTLRG